MDKPWERGRDLRRNYTGLYSITNMLPEREWSPPLRHFPDRRVRIFLPEDTAQVGIHTDLSLQMIELNPYLGVERHFIPDWMQPIGLPLGRVEDYYRSRDDGTQRIRQVVDTNVYEMLLASRYVRANASKYKVNVQSAPIAEWWLLGVSSTILAKVLTWPEYDLERTRGQIAFWLRTITHPNIIEAVRSGIAGDGRWLLKRIPFVPTVGAKLAKFDRMSIFHPKARELLTTVEGIITRVTTWNIAGVETDRWLRQYTEEYPREASDYRTRMTDLFSETAPTIAAILPPTDIPRIERIGKSMDLRPLIEAMKAKLSR